MDTLCGIKHVGTISVHGLTEQQQEIVMQLTEMLRAGSTHKRRELSHEEFELPGKITAELIK